MSEYTQGVSRDGAAILKDGQPLSIEQILEALREREALAAHVERFKSCRLESGRISLLRVRELLGDTPCISLARRDALKQAEIIEQWADCLESVICHVEAEHSKDPNYPAIGAEGMGEFAADMRTEAEKLRKEAEGHQ